MSYAVYYGELKSNGGSSYTWASKTLMYSTNIEFSNDMTYAIMDPVLIREANQAGSFECDVPYGNACYDSLRYLLGVVSVEKNGKEIWQGRITSIDTDMDAYKHIYCEGDMSYLNDQWVKVDWESVKIASGTNYIYDPVLFFEQYCGCSITNDGKYISSSMSEGSSKLISYIMDSMYNETGDVTYMSSWDALCNSLIGGILNSVSDRVFVYIDRSNITENGGTRKLRMVVSKPDVSNGFLLGSLDRTNQVIEYGVNLKNITISADLTNLVTKATAYGYATSGWWIFKNTIPIGYTAYDNEAISKYGIFEKIVNVDGTDCTMNMLAEVAKSALTPINTALNITVNAIDLSLIEDTDELDFMKITHIKSPWHGIDDDFICTKITEHLDDPTNSEYVFGSASSAFSKKYASGNIVTNKAYTMSKATMGYVASS